MAIQVGQTLGNYKLIRHLGSGGFGDVFLGENIFFSRQVAIKQGVRQKKKAADLD